MEIKNNDLHRMIWPYDPWKDKRIVNVPLNYLRVFIRDTKKDNEEKAPWVERAQAELKRRHFIPNHVFITEHVVERFTQYFPEAHSRYLKLTKKDKLKPEARPGLTTFIKGLFNKAILKGITLKAVGNDTGAGNYHTKHGRYRWTYGLYGTGIKEGLVYEHKVISIVPTKVSKRKKD